MPRTRIILDPVFGKREIRLPRTKQDKVEGYMKKSRNKGYRELPQGCWYTRNNWQPANELVLR